VAVMREAGVQMLAADKALVEDVRKRTAPLEQKWVGEAKALGLADPAQVLKEFRAEVAKAK